MNQITLVRFLAYVTGLVNQELLLQNEYLAAENRLLKAHLQPRLRLSNGEKATLAEIGKRLGRQALQQVAHVAKPDTILGWHSPNLNAYAERWVRTVKEECLSKLILFGEASLRRALSQFQVHYHSERNHQGKGNVLLFPRAEGLAQSRGSSTECRERLGGLLKYYYRRAA